MPRVHLLNVSPGDCSIIQHASGRVTMMDICSGNQVLKEELRKAYAADEAAKKPGGNFGMCNHSTDPIEYLTSIGIDSVFRFILSHPDMDHMDGIDRLFTEKTVRNFWDSGSRREKPSFDYGRYKEEDWDRYIRIRDGKENGTTSLVKQAGARFALANKTSEDQPGGDGLYIAAPDTNLINDPNTSDDINEGSYVISYRSAGGKIVLPGDAHDAGWDYISKNCRDDVQNCAFMLAPHHGRDSSRSYDFLDLAKPKFTLIEGIASVVMQTTLRVNGPGTVIMPPSCPARD